MKIPVYDLKSRYKFIRALGEGNFGAVWLATSLVPHDTGTQCVAIKSLRSREEDAQQYQTSREYQFYCKVPDHKSIVALHEFFVDDLTMQCHLVMEPLDMNLYQLIRAQGCTPLKVDWVASIAHGILRGLVHIHEYGFLHRDLKPENIMLNNPNNWSSGDFQVKIADFGLSRRSDSCKKFTTYVSTRWYRAPELLFMLPYSYAMDIWAFGSLIAELANLAPIFPGSSLLGQINCQLSILGTPRPTCLGGSWHDFGSLVTYLSLPFDFYPGITRRSLLKYPQHVPLIDLVATCLQWDPACRPSSSSLLHYECLARQQRLPLKQIANQNTISA